jgi:putative spermidine/putrescine transport system substrate-binding protein
MWSRGCAGLVATAIVSVLVGCGSDKKEEPSHSGGSLAGTKVTFATFGGEQDGDYKKVYTGPVEKQTGLKIVYDGPVDYSKVQAQVKAGKVDWDVVQADPWWVQAHCGTLAEPLRIADNEVLPQYAAGDCGVPADVASYNVMYDSKKFGADPPKGWADFFDKKKYPGKRAVWGAYAVNGMLEGALLADGVAPKDLYPLDLDRAFKKLDTIKDDITFYTTIAQAQEMMRSKQVALAVLTNVNGYYQARSGGDFVPVWNQPIVYWDAWFVPKGADLKAATPLLEQILKPDAQLGLTEIAPRAAAVKTAAPKLSGLLEKWSAAAPDRLSTAVFQDQSYYAESADVVTQRWTEWVAGG